ncbi:MAG: hypothetical protein JO247_08660, partial [Chloroflexi bacterium]|nr:hypothetical protein [Chloroflexota bacterium]
DVAGEYDLALRRFRETGPFYGVFGGGPGFANHGPMVAEVLASWGRADEIAGWTEAYSRLLKPRPPALAPIDDWQSALGDWGRAGDWLAYFSEALRCRGADSLVREWLPRLLPGPDMLGHGPIRVFHVLRALSDERTPEREDEVADALAYWAVAYDRAFALGEAEEPEPDSLVLEGAWAYISRPDLRPIVLTHAVTAPRAIRELLPWLDDAGRQLALRVAASLSEQIRTPYRAPRPELPSNRLSRDELIERAIASGDDHAIKLTEACLDQFERDPAPVYLAVADDVTRRLRADWL